MEQLIGLASDHAGYELKEFVKSVLNENGIQYRDFGTLTPDRCDYPDFGHRLAEAVATGEVFRGIAVCGTGNGINIALNRHSGIRSVLCWNEEIARLTRLHNDANVLVLPGRFIDKEEARKCILTFLSSPFEGGRHTDRIKKIEVVR
jgi:ribose 5-phosphate isomerase B